MAAYLPSQLRQTFQTCLYPVQLQCRGCLARWMGSACSQGAAFSSVYGAAASSPHKGTGDMMVGSHETRGPQMGCGTRERHPVTSCLCCIYGPLCFPV